MHHILVGVLQKWKVELGHNLRQLALLVQGELQSCSDGCLDRGAVKLRVPLACVCISQRQECAIHLQEVWTSLSISDGDCLSFYHGV